MSSDVFNGINELIDSLQKEVRDLIVENKQLRAENNLLIEESKENGRIIGMGAEREIALADRVRNLEITLRHFHRMGMNPKVENAEFAHYVLETIRKTIDFDKVVL